MPASFKKVEADARSLSSEDRARLAQVILESLQTSDPVLEKEWASEVARRVEAYDRGELTTLSAEDVFAETRRVTK